MNAALSLESCDPDLVFSRGVLLLLLSSGSAGGDGRPVLGAVKIVRPVGPLHLDRVCAPALGRADGETLGGGQPGPVGGGEGVVALQSAFDA
jgi:hypothetical protein